MKIELEIELTKIEVHVVSQIDGSGLGPDGLEAQIQGVVVAQVIGHVNKKVALKTATKLMNRA